MLGYRPDEFPGRAVFEALGRGQDVSDEHVFAYAALRPAERRDDGWWLTGRPDPERDAEEAERAGRALRRDRGGRPDLLARARLARRGGPADRRRRRRSRHRHRRLLPRPGIRCCGPQPLVPEAERTARACEAWTREVMRRLEGERFNVITLKWLGRPRPVPELPRAPRRARRLRGRLGVPARPRDARRARAASTRPRPTTRSATCAAASSWRSERLDAGDTFVFSHQKATDAAGHTKDPQIKQSTIEALDAALGDLPTDRAIVCITGDHATPASPDVIHSGDPVPFLVAGPGVRADEVERFGELDCARRDPRPPARARPDAGAPERRRPAALPRLAADAVRRRRRVPGPARAASLAFAAMEATHSPASGGSSSRRRGSSSSRRRTLGAPLADRRHRRGGAADGLRASAAATGPAASGGTRCRRRTTTPSSSSGTALRRRRRDLAHAADRGSPRGRRRACRGWARRLALGDLRRHARPGAARLPRGGERPALAGRGCAPAALDGAARGRGRARARGARAALAAAPSRSCRSSCGAARWSLHGGAACCS